MRVTISQLSPVAIMQAFIRHRQHHRPGTVRGGEDLHDLSRLGQPYPDRTFLGMALNAAVSKSSIGAVWKYRYPSDFR